MPKSIEDLYKDYTEFVEGLQGAVENLVKNNRNTTAKIVYTLQIGSAAGSDRHFFSDRETENNRKKCCSLDVPLETFLDRSIGNITLYGNPSTQLLSRAKQLAEWICLKTYAFRNEICNAHLKDIVNTPLSSDEVGKQSYNHFASRFNEILSTSGFVIWHVCKETKVNDEFELFDVEEGENDLPKTLFLHALGSSNPQHSVDMPFSEGIASYVLLSGKILRVDDLLDGRLVSELTGGRSIKHKPVVNDLGWKSGVFLPLKSQGHVVGVIGAYSPRKAGFNNLDEVIVTRCAEIIAAYFLIHRAKQRNAVLVDNVAELGTEVSAAQYSVVGSVHDAINTSAAIRDNFDFIQPTFATKTFFEAAKDHSIRLKDVLGKLRSDIKNPRDIPLKIAKVNLHDFLEDKLAALDVDAQSRGVELKIRVPHDITFYTDEFRISQIFFNLVSNAIRHFSYTRRNPKTITISASDREDRIVVNVRDNGPGIDPAYLPKRIFEPFVTTSNGMGLGLTIVENFVKELNGKISVRSEWGKETEFDLVFPKKLIK